MTDVFEKCQSNMRFKGTSEDTLLEILTLCFRSLIVGGTAVEAAGVWLSSCPLLNPKPFLNRSIRRVKKY